MFGKPGRPREDGFRRRREIYTAVAPLIEKVGARELTMRQAANAAHMSLGGVYHYFGSKRELVLFGLSREAMQRVCADLHQQLSRVEGTDPEARLSTFQDLLAEAVSFCRPALLAGIELGAGPLFDGVAAGTKAMLDELVEMVKAVRTDMGDAAADEFAALHRAMYHSLLGAMLDRSVTAEEWRSELRSIVETTLLATPGVGERQAVPGLV
jgi:AcrR family transcriptional regulator